MEKTIADVWKGVLGIESVSAHENFFEIGGHSLLSIQVVTQLEKRIGLRINPREFFNQTLGQLAASMERQVRSIKDVPGFSPRSSLLQKLKKRIFAFGYR
jgi:acyl carrier protein